MWLQVGLTLAMAYMSYYIASGPAGLSGTLFMVLVHFFRVQGCLYHAPVQGQGWCSSRVAAAAVAVAAGQSDAEHGWAVGLKATTVAV